MKVLRECRIDECWEKKVVCRRCRSQLLVEEKDLETREMNQYSWLVYYNCPVCGEFQVVKALPAAVKIKIILKSKQGK